MPGKVSRVGALGRTCKVHAWRSQGLCGVCGRWKIGTEQRTRFNFWRKVKMSDACWIWMGAMDENARGEFLYCGKVWRAHRLSWTWFYGEIPSGLVLDHLCKNGRCVNPNHLEPVTHRENKKRDRKPYCGKGHKMSGQNVYWWRPKKGTLRRKCRECSRLRKGRTPK